MGGAAPACGGPHPAAASAPPADAPHAPAEDGARGGGDAGPSSPQGGSGPVSVSVPGGEGSQLARFARVGRGKRKRDADSDSEDDSEDEGALAAPPRRKTRRKRRKEGDPLTPQKQLSEQQVCIVERLVKEDKLHLAPTDAKKKELTQASERALSKARAELVAAVPGHKGYAEELVHKRALIILNKQRSAQASAAKAKEAQARDAKLVQQGCLTKADAAAVRKAARAMVEPADLGAGASAQQQEGLGAALPSEAAPSRARALCEAFPPADDGAKRGGRYSGCQFGLNEEGKKKLDAAINADAFNDLGVYEGGLSEARKRAYALSVETILEAEDKKALTDKCKEDHPARFGGAGNARRRSGPRESQQVSFEDDGERVEEVTTKLTGLIDEARQMCDHAQNGVDLFADDPTVTPDAMRDKWAALNEAITEVDRGVGLTGPADREPMLEALQEADEQRRELAMEAETLEGLLPPDKYYDVSWATIFLSSKTLRLSDGGSIGSANDGRMVQASHQAATAVVEQAKQRRATAYSHTSDPRPGRGDKSKLADPKKSVQNRAKTFANVLGEHHRLGNILGYRLTITMDIGGKEKTVVYNQDKENTPQQTGGPLPSGPAMAA